MARRSLTDLFDSPPGARRPAESVEPEHMRRDHAPVSRARPPGDQAHRDGQRSAGQNAADPAPVSQVVHMLERAMTNVGQVVVIGEISSFKRWRNGNLYFDLRDNNAHLPCMMRDGQARRLPFAPQDGQRVIAWGRPSLYRGQMKTQLLVTALKRAGTGDFKERLEELKKSLHAEGLFAPETKKKLPALVRTLGVVTSPQGAAVRDIIKVARARNPHIRIILSPTRVQGERADEDIVRALIRLDRTAQCDVIVIGRGGGSLEDLMAFNAERTARAVFHCQTPVVSSVGHETDTSLTDLCADARAATPSHAAELCVPVLDDQKAVLTRYQTQMFRRVKAHLERAHLQLVREEKKLRVPDVQRQARALQSVRGALDAQARRRLRSVRAECDALAERLERAAPRSGLVLKKRALVPLKERLQAARPDVAAARVRHQALTDRLLAAGPRVLDDKRRALAELVAGMHKLSPLAVLDRGYAVVETRDGRLVPSRDAASRQTDLSIRFYDGNIDVRVDAPDEETS